MPAGIEASKSDLVRMIGARICRFTNGTPCLCLEKDRTLCSNVKALAIEVYDLAHLGELTREEWNQTQRLHNELYDSKDGKRVRPK